MDGDVGMSPSVAVAQPGGPGLLQGPAEPPIVQPQRLAVNRAGACVQVGDDGRLYYVQLASTRNATSRPIVFSSGHGDSGPTASPFAADGLSPHALSFNSSGDSVLLVADGSVSVAHLADASDAPVADHIPTGAYAAQPQLAGGVHAVITEGVAVDVCRCCCLWLYVWLCVSIRHAARVACVSDCALMGHVRAPGRRYSHLGPPRDCDRSSGVTSCSRGT